MWSVSQQRLTVAAGRRPGLQNEHSLRNREQIISVYTLVLPILVVGADTAGIDHDTTIRVGLGVEQVVAFGAEV